MGFQLVPILLFCCIIYLNVAVKPNFECKSSKDCICSRFGKHYAFDCPVYDPSVSITVFPDSEIKINCLKESINWDDEYLPLTEGNLKLLTLIRCPVPKSGFGLVMQKLGVSTIKQLKFDFTPSKNITFTSSHFEGLDNLEKLILNDDNIKMIDGSVFKLLNSLVEVELQSNAIQLTENMFQHLSKLELLDISQNELLYLPSGLFQRLTELQVLYMQYNNLTRLHRRTFENLWNLETLDLHNNMIEDLSEEVFFNLQSLKKLSLAMNRLQSVPENVFSRNIKLEFVSLEGNLLTHLPNELFSNLTKLERILLNECKLNNLPSDLFQGSVHLQDISLQNNALEELPEDIFNGLTELKSLDMSYNKLSDLPDNLFSSLIELQTLSFESNLLKNISKRLLYNLENLEMINLKNNRISFIHSQTFARNVNLKEIILSYNYLDIPENEANVSPFNNNLYLEIVDLSHNNISNLGQDWWTTVNLKNLDYSYNEISYLDFASLLGLSRRLSLNLSHNKLQTVNFQNVDTMVRIQGNLDLYSSNSEQIVVNINNNPIECDCYIHDFVRYFDGSIDSAVLSLLKMVADDLRCAGPKNVIGTPIAKLKTNMLTCTLEQLEIYSPCPENCECLISIWDKSFIVNCKNKSLTTAPELVFPEEEVFNQTKVYLQENFLILGPNASMGYENVTELYLSSNNINDVAWIPPKLMVLDLDNNNITELKYNVLSMLNSSSLTKISLGNNPWNCDCSAANFTKLLVLHSHNKQIDTNIIKCQNNGYLLIHLSKEELCSDNTTFILVVGSIISVVVLAIIASTALVYASKQKIRVWMFANNICLWFVSEEEIDKDKLYDVFVSYAHQDEDFVLSELVPVLEQDPQPYKLCIHIRDWIAGKFISEQITKSVQDSRRTLVVVSPNFLQSIWGKMEFRTAHTQAMTEGRNRVIVVIYGDVDVKTDLDEDLKAYVATNTYVKWGEPWFWKKLRYALPHTQKLETI